MSLIPNKVMLDAITAYAAEHGGFLHGRGRLDKWLKAHDYPFTATVIKLRFGGLQYAASEAGVLYAGGRDAINRSKQTLHRFLRWAKERPFMGKTWLLWQLNKDTKFKDALEKARARYVKKFGHEPTVLYVSELYDGEIETGGLELKTDKYLNETYFTLAGE